jgi:hypothetical protein
VPNEPRKTSKELDFLQSLGACGLNTLPLLSERSIVYAVRFHNVKTKP